MRNRKVVLAAASSAATALLLSQSPVTAATPYFLPGGLVMMEVSRTDFSGGDPASLIELNPATGAVISSVSPLPIGTTQVPFSVSDNSQDHDRQLNLSANGQYISFVGYNTAPASADPATALASQIPRTVGLVDANGNVNLSTQLTDAYDGTSIRASYTTNGTNIWTAGDNASGATTDGGLHYTTVGSSTSVNLSTVQTLNGPHTPDNVRSVRVFNSQLYESSGSNASVTKGFFQVGSGLPTSGMPALDLLSTENYSVTGFLMLDTNHDGTLDTIYCGDSSNDWLDKYCYINGIWQFEGNVVINGGDADNVTAIENPDGSANIYVGTLNDLYRVTDPTPYGGNLTNATRTLLLTGSNLSSGTSLVNLGGFDFAPQIADTNQWSHTTAGGWGTTTNWATGVSPETQGATATFGPSLTSSGVIGLGGSQTVGHVVFNNSSASYTIGTSSSDTLVIDDSTLNSAGIPSIIVDAGSHTIQAALSLENAVRVTTSASTSLTISGPITGSGGFYADGLGSLTLSGSNSYSGNTGVASGTATLAASGTLPSTTNLTIGDGDLYASAVFNISAGTPGAIKTIALQSLTIQQNGTVNMQSATSHTSRTFVNTGGLTFTGTTGAWTGQLDLGTNDIDVQNGSLANITNQIAQGYNGGSWNGVGGITSTAAANDTTHLTAIGAILNGNLYSATTGKKFDGIYPNSTDVLLKYTFYGDANLDGYVDGSDYSLIDDGFNNHLSGWVNGDFNYDGVVNGSDYALIDNAYLSQHELGNFAAEVDPTVQIAAQIALAGPVSAVPEPTAAVLFGISAAGLLGRHKRRPVANGF